MSRFSANIYCIHNSCNSSVFVFFYLFNDMLIKHFLRNIFDNLKLKYDVITFYFNFVYSTVLGYLRIDHY